jgi:uncharacterized membrane protein
VISARGARILGLVVVISIAINLFLAGAMLGGRFRGPPPPVPLEQRLDALWGELPEGDRSVAEEIYARHRDEIIQKWHASRAAAQRANRGMRASTFNEGEVRADIAASNDRFMEFRRAVQDLFIDIGGKISQEGRERLRAPGGAF